MKTGVVIALGFLCCVLVAVSVVLGLYFGKVFCPKFGYKCSSSPAPSPRTPGSVSGSPTPRTPATTTSTTPTTTTTSTTPTTTTSTSPTCTGRTKLNAAGTACEPCGDDFPIGKGYRYASGCEYIDCLPGQYGYGSITGCVSCPMDDTSVPPGWILQGGVDDCAIIRCQSGTTANSAKTQCVPNPPTPPPPSGCTGYWNNGTQCHMPRACGQRGYYIDTYVVPSGSGACSIANGSTIDTRLCDNWPQAPPGGVIPCI